MRIIKKFHAHLIYLLSGLGSGLGLGLENAGLEPINDSTVCTLKPNP